MGRVIEIDPSAGFCFGVEKAIDTAEALLREGEPVYGLGEMVHNEEEIGRLEKLGLRTISTDDFAKIAPAKVIFRAHGEPPLTYEKAKAHGVGLIDATCPIVLSLQRKISSRFAEMDREKEQIVIFGKAGHPETIGLVGQTGGAAVVVTDPENIAHVDPGKKIYLYSQTTMDPAQFRILEENLKKVAEVAGGGGLVSTCSICHQMKRRKPDLKAFALKHDVMIFVSGTSSSNGKMLFAYCKKHNSRSFWIHRLDDIDPEWLEGAKSIGISGATSTPAWQLEQVRGHLESFISD
ncbi:MAG: 4-hydroxy-3-methylbut-2-enyl diphosphate reductase [Bacteroidales bacterium]|nr:4-hydroxy-3-methylbut-2-enyl diphosphate reductase [Bacteroidales bacterium]